jgi:hypothetical protein
MMTDEDAPAREREAAVPPHSYADNLAGQCAIVELLDAQDALAPRTLVSRVFGVTPLTDETRPLYQSAIGETEVGQALETLGDSWISIHSLPVAAGGADIDHLVIGPTGVYIVTTRNHSRQTVWASQRTLMVGGIRYPDIRNMEYEMGRVERLLSAATGRGIEVSGILAVVSPKSLTVRQKHRDVEVLASDQIVPWLQMRRRVLAPDDVREIAAAAALPETWAPDSTAPRDTAVLAARFDALRTEVSRAWRLQLTWAVLASVIAAGGFLAVTYVILLTSLGMLPR